MGEKISRKTIVIGHKNPDTDSICSAICYANLKRCVTGENYQPGRAGAVNEETQFVLKHFNVEAPEIIENVKTQVRDIEIRETAGVKKNLSLKKAWNIMQEANVVTIPAVTEEGLLEGLITVGDIAKSYMNVYDSSILSKANTQYANIVETLEGAMIVGDETSYFSEGKVLIAAANPDMMEYYISRGDLVILGNRYESQLCAIEMDAACIIVCEGAAVSMTIKKLAQEHGCTVMTTPYDTFTAARLVNQSMPISYFMKTEALITFEMDDYIDDIKDVMASKRHRDFPILDKNGRYRGMISRRNLLGAKGKRIILVDHNEKSQAVEGMESARFWKSSITTDWERWKPLRLYFSAISRWAVPRPSSIRCIRKTVWRSNRGSPVCCAAPSFPIRCCSGHRPVLTWIRGRRSIWLKSPGWKWNRTLLPCLLREAI